MKLTPDQKLAALAHRFYSDGSWTPKAGDFYTTSRADLELYQVVSVEDDITRTRYTEGSDTISEWPTAGFLTEGFGPRRVHVPEWVMSAVQSTTKIDDGGLAFPGRRNQQVGNISDYGFSFDGEDSPTFGDVEHPGMTLRDHFASQALPSVVSAHAATSESCEVFLVARDAYRIADAMIVTRRG